MSKKMNIKMPVFKSSDHLYSCAWGLFARMKADPEASITLKTINLSIQFILTDPDTSITHFHRNEEQLLHYEENEIKADIKVTMTGDVVHSLLLGELNFITAYTQKKIVSESPIFKLLKIIPLLKAAIKIYPQYYLDFKKKEI